MLPARSASSTTSDLREAAQAHRLDPLAQHIRSIAAQPRSARSSEVQDCGSSSTSDRLSEGRSDRRELEHFLRRFCPGEHLPQCRPDPNSTLAVVFDHLGSGQGASRRELCLSFWAAAVRARQLCSAYGLCKAYGSRNTVEQAPAFRLGLRALLCCLYMAESERLRRLQVLAQTCQAVRQGSCSPPKRPHGSLLCPRECSVLFGHRLRLPSLSGSVRSRLLSKCSGSSILRPATWCSKPSTSALRQNQRAVLPWHSNHARNPLCTSVVSCMIASD